MTAQPESPARPRHVGLIMDGNRRWARAAGRGAPFGHRAGAEHLGDFLRWLEARGIEHATVYVLSADNIRKRADAEISHLFQLIETVVSDEVRESMSWRLHVSGDLSLLPVRARAALERTVGATIERPRHLTLAIGYDPRGDIVAGVRAAILTGASGLSGEQLVEAITEGLPGGPVKEIDLVIRTSGEQRISGFFPWQAQHAEIHVSPQMWPAFTERDLDRALARLRHQARLTGRLGHIDSLARHRRQMRTRLVDRHFDDDSTADSRTYSQPGCHVKSADSASARATPRRWCSRPS